MATGMALCCCFTQDHWTPSGMTNHLMIFPCSSFVHIKKNIKILFFIKYSSLPIKIWLLTLYIIKSNIPIKTSLQYVILLLGTSSVILVQTKSEMQSEFLITNYLEFKIE